jgi:signal transduction histidine kinase
MFHSLTMFQKLLLVIAIPLAAQAGFIIMLFRAQAESASAVTWAVHTKEVIAKVEEIYRILLEGHGRIREAAARNRAAPATAQGDLDRIPGEIARLRATVADNPAQQSRIDELAASAGALVRWIDELGQGFRAGRNEEASDQLNDGDRLLGTIRTCINGILAEEMRLDQSRLLRLRGSRSRQYWLVLGGGAAVLAATSGLAVLWINGVTRRLGILRENARRLSAGLGLQAPLFGRDEIADVDRAFHEMAAGLDQQKQENEMFVYSVSHDLRSPLINLQGFSEELGLSYRRLQTLFDHEAVPAPVRRQVKSLLSEDIEDSIRYIQTAVGRLARIIDAMLRLARAGRVEYQWQSVDIAAIIPKITGALEDTIAEKGAHIAVGELPPAWGDPTAVEQIFANLIDNAVVYLDPARLGEIEVGCSGGGPTDGRGGMHVYYVKDNGLGIAAAYHEKVFTAFSRLHPHVAHGEGIGLALVHRMVARHGGKIWLESAVGAGTTFFVALPSAPPDGARSRNADHSTGKIGEKGDRAEWQPNRS